MAMADACGAVTGAATTCASGADDASVGIEMNRSRSGTATGVFGVDPPGTRCGGYHLPSDANHHPGPCDTSLISDLLQAVLAPTG